MMTVKLYIPSTTQLVLLDQDEETAILTQKKFISENLIAWIIYTKK